MNGLRGLTSSLKQRDSASHRKHTASVISVSSSNYESNPVNDDDQNLLNTPAVRNILGFDQRYDRVEEQEVLSQMNCHWLLSIDDFKVPIEHPQGLISQMSPLNENHLYLMLPYDESMPHLDYRELHQIIRELTIGIYVLNQHPLLQLEANFDESTSCQLPVAYVDTKLGQIMINTDYWLKALWHGSYFPREKRMKFTERWRQMIDVDANGIAQTKKSVFYEFLNSGLSDICKDTEYSSVFDKSLDSITNKKDDGNSMAFGVGMTAANSGFMNGNQQTPINPGEYENMSEDQIQDDLNLLMSCIDDVSVIMTFGCNSIKNYKNIYEIDSSYSINACVRADNQKVDHKKFERVKPILNAHEKFLRENFEKKQEIKKNLTYLKIVSFLTPLLIGLKRRMKIPDMNNLLPLMTGDDVLTERELPPLMLSNDFKTKRFFPLLGQDKNKYFNLHGGVQFELETCHITNEDLADEYDNITTITSKILKTYLESEQLQEYKVPLVQVKDKKYWSIRIDFESYYSASPQKPYWVYKLTEDLSKIKPKRLPMTDIQIYDLFKKYFGYKKATKFKNPASGLRAASQRGLINIFQSFSRKTPANRLAKHDEYGLCLTHYAAIYNRPLIISSLIMDSIDVNTKQQIDYLAIGPMPLHYAARSGSLDTVSCLLANYANISFADNEGWAPIHHACYFDNVPVIKLLIRRQQELLEITTRAESRKTPILVAASAGSLEAVKCLISLGANLSFHDENGYNIIHIAAHRNRTNIIDYFITNEYPQLPTWKLLINMLTSEKDQDKLASVKCLQLLTNQSKKFWHSILNAGGIERLCAIMRKYITTLTQPNKTQIEEEISFNALSVICNLSDQIQVKQKLNEIKDLSTILIKILELSKNEDLHSRSAILIADVVSIDEANKTSFAQQGCLDRLMFLLDGHYEDLLVNAINAIEIMCKENQENQNYCAEKGIFQSFLSIMDLNSDLIKSSVAAAISALTYKNKKNQLIAMDQGIFRPLVDLLKSRNMTVQLKVSMALEALAIRNQTTQDALLELDAATYMIRLLERMYYVGATIKSNMEDWSIIVREQAAFTLWTLAGAHKPQRKMISQKIGISQIISMLISKSEKLQYVGAKCVVSLVFENLYNQNQILKENGIDPLIRLLKLEKTSHRVILAVVETIGALCVDIAHVNNEKTQTELAEKGAIGLLLKILENPPTKFIQIETAHAIACLILNRPNNQYLDKKLDIRLILSLLDTDDLEMRLKAGSAITVLAYNNTENQYDIKINGGISFDYYAVFFQKKTINPLLLCRACFQTVVLARVINGKDHVELTATSIDKLVQLLLFDDDQVVIQTASYLSSLAHTRAGITDAMITCDAVDILCDRLYAPNDQIRFASAITLGYLSFNRTASRLLLHNCRNQPHLYKTLMSIIPPNAKISKQFIESFQTSYALGLPKLLAQNQVKFYDSARNPKMHDEFKGFYLGKELNRGNFSKMSFYDESRNDFNSKSMNTATSRSQSAPISKLILIESKEKRTRNPTMLDMKKPSKIPVQ